MRSIEFDMVAMSLMALGVIFTCGVLLMIGYSKASRTRKPDHPAPVEEADGVRRESGVAGSVAEVAPLDDPVQVTAPRPGDAAHVHAGRA
jgi:hypothetical protein